MVDERRPMYAIKELLGTITVASAPGSLLQHMYVIIGILIICMELGSEAIIMSICTL